VIVVALGVAVQTTNQTTDNFLLQQLYHTELWHALQKIVVTHLLLENQTNRTIRKL